MSVSLVKTPAWLQRAAELGRRRGEAAASWYFDGNTDQATYVRVRRGMDEGDPEILDTFAIPDLSGEWADGETPRSLAAELGIAHDDALLVDNVDEACDAWEAGALEGYTAELERAISAQLDAESLGAGHDGHVACTPEGCVIR